MRCRLCPANAAHAGSTGISKYRAAPEVAGQLPPLAVRLAPRKPLAPRPGAKGITASAVSFNFYVGVGSVMAHTSSFHSFSARGSSYTSTAIALHWLIALLIVCGFALGWVMTDIPGFTPTKLKYFSWHKWIGVTVFALVIIRILWRATHATPPMPSHMPKWQRGIAHLTHFLLYVLMVAIPVS